MRADIGERTSRAVVSAAWREAETSSARAARSAADGPAASSSPRPSAASASASVLKAYFFPSSIMHPRHAGVISSRELAVHNVGLNGYEERGAPIGSRAGRVGVPTGTLTR